MTKVYSVHLTVKTIAFTDFIFLKDLKHLALSLVNRIRK